MSLLILIIYWIKKPLHMDRKFYNRIREGNEEVTGKLRKVREFTGMLIF